MKTGIESERSPLGWLMLLSGLILLGLAVGRTGVLRRTVEAWLGLDFVIVGVAHLTGRHRVFGKRADGRLPVWSWALFLPYFGGTHLLWQVVKRARGERAWHAYDDRLRIGRRLVDREIDGPADNYVDLTTEFPAPAAARGQAGYVNVPILDGSAPRPDVILRALAALRPGTTYVHCAQGHGRTGLFAVAWLLREGEARSVDEALAKLRRVRPRVSLNALQRRCAEAIAHQLAQGRGVQC